MIFKLVDIGLGVLVPRAKLTLIRATTGTKLTRNLVDIVFSKEELVGSSVTGKRSRGTEEKQSLDETKVAAVKDYVQKQFPTTTWSDIRQSLADKIKEETRLSKPTADQVPSGFHSSPASSEN